MASLLEISSYLSGELELSKYPDSSVNGIQVEGGAEIKKICVSVDAGLSVVQAAVNAKADLLLVHHGILWGGGPPVVGVHKKLLELLIVNKITLYAAHIPLDAHTEYGNNFCLARFLGFGELQQSLEYQGQKIGCKGVNTPRLSISKIEELLAELPGGSAPILSLNFGPNPPQKIAICSGAAADELYKYEVEEFDTLITGEPRQFAYHFCKERKLNAIFAGHYRSETLGVRTLGDRLSKRFGVEYEFIDQPTGI